MNVTLRLFAAVRDIVGESSRELSVNDGATAADVWSVLADQHPKLSAHPIPMVAINQEYADPEQRLQEGDELAFIPPVSGG